MPKLSSNSIALAGEFAVLSQLALHGYDANMTLGNTKNIDILVSDTKTNIMYQLEVKTNYRREIGRPHNSKIFGKIVSTWIMRKGHENIRSKQLFYCFVNIDSNTNQPSFYIIPNKIVAEYVKKEHIHWLAAKHGEGKDTDMRCFRLGVADYKYPINTPIAEKYKNNWTFKF